MNSLKKLFLLALSIFPAVAFAPRGDAPRSPSNPKSARSYSNLADPPHDTSFENRMRRIVTKPVDDNVAVMPGHPAVRRVTNLAQLQEGTHGDQIKVVRFYADYCRACKAMTPPFYRIAQTKSDDVTWMEMPANPDTMPIIRALDVPAVPYCHIYHPQLGLVETLRLRKQFMSDFAQILQSYQDGECSLPDEPNPETGVFSAPYQRRV